MRNETANVALEQCAAGAAAETTAGVSRRQFVSGLLGAGVLIAGSGLSVSGCAKKDSATALMDTVAASAPGATVNSLVMGDSQLVSSETFTSAQDTDYFSLEKTLSLPFGSLLYQQDDRMVCVLSPGEESNVLVRLGLLDLETGELHILRERAENDAAHFCIYDARLNSSVAAWVEVDMITGNWKLYAAGLDGFQLTRIELLDEGDALYEPPMLCVWEHTVYWTLMPDPYGAASTKDSYLKAARVAHGGGAEGGADAWVGLGAEPEAEPRIVYTSHGRMLTNPQVTEGYVSIVPRVDINEVCYQLTALDTRTDEVVAISVLPVGLRVSDCVYTQENFTFCIEANYTFAEGLRYFGSYGQNNDATVFHAHKVPASPAAFVNNALIIKSVTNIVGFDVARQTSFVIDKPNDCINYGDLLAGCGAQKKLVIYTTLVDKSDAEKSYVQVRIYGPAEAGTSA